MMSNGGMPVPPRESALPPCASCARAEMRAGVLCERCASSLCAIALCPEQIFSGTEAASDAVFADCWGRLHRLSTPRCTVGRAPGGFMILEPSVSRQHAVIDEVEGVFAIADRGSSNGTFVNGERLAGRRVLANGDRVAFGDVGFLFFREAPQEPTPSSISETVIPPSLSTEFEAEGDTFCGLRDGELELVEHSGGAGGVLTLADLSVQLTLIQYELFRVLDHRMTTEAGSDERVRGFVRSSELLALLPWDTARADDNHLKQLIRRARRTLSRSGIPDIIEARHGFGYRLRIRSDRAPRSRQSRVPRAP